jgi:hypothetical protein
MDVKEIVTAWAISFNPTKEQARLALQRASICKTCPHLKSKLTVDFCGVCGCPVSKKIFTDRINPCPKKKWEQIDLKHFGKRKENTTLL